MVASTSSRPIGRFASRRTGNAILGFLLAAGLAGVAIELGDESSEVALATSRNGRGPGFTYAGETAFARKGALIVTSIERGGQAERSDIRIGDIIDRINGQPVTSAAGFADAIGATDGQEISLRLRRGGSIIVRTLPATALAGKR